MGKRPDSDSSNADRSTWPRGERRKSDKRGEDQMRSGPAEVPRPAPANSANKQRHFPRRNDKHASLSTRFHQHYHRFIPSCSDAPLFSCSFPSAAATHPWPTTGSRSITKRPSFPRCMIRSRRITSQRLISTTRLIFGASRFTGRLYSTRRLTFLSLGAQF